MTESTEGKLKDFENLRSVRIRNLSSHHFDEEFHYHTPSGWRWGRIGVKPKSIGEDYIIYNKDHAEKVVQTLLPLVKRGLLRVTYINGEPTNEQKLVLACYTQPSHPRYIPPTDPRSPFYSRPTSKKRINDDN